MKTQKMDEIESARPSEFAFPHKYLLGSILLAAFVLRAWQPEKLSIEHFDEGVYASNFYSSHLDYRYPDRHLYAPPFLPALLEWILILTGNPHAVVWVNIILGTALVAAIWWLTNLIAGKEAGVAAASIAAFNDFLIQYSRAVLTDTPVCLFVLLAVGWGLIALRERRAKAAIIACCLTATAWWTKYNGWLPLAILGAGLSGWIIFEKPEKKVWLPRSVLYFLISGGAFLFWAPFLWQLQQYGGYSEVAKNHSGYLVGFTGWFDSFWTQIQTQRHYSDRTLIGILIGAMSYQFAVEPNLKNWSRTFWALCFLIAIVGVLNAPLFLLIPLALYGLCRKQLLEPLGFWILLAWTVGLLLSTPMYRPYPRLMILLITSGIIAAGLGIAAILKRTDQETESQGIFGLLPRLVLLGLSFSVTFNSGTGSSVYQDRTQLKQIADSVIGEMNDSTGSTKKIGDLNAVIYVIGEPALYYHLASDSSLRYEFIAQPASNLAMLKPSPNEPAIPTFLVVGPQAIAEKKELQRHSQYAEIIQRFPYQPSDLVLLDKISSTELENNRKQFVELWKLSRH